MRRKRIHILVLTALLVCCICIIPAHAASGEPDQSPGIIDPAAVVPGITPPFTEGDSFDNPIILSDGSTLSVTISSAQSYRYLKFVPSASGIYTIESYNSTCDPAVWLYDAEYNQLGYNDNIGNDVNFRMALILQQGETYYFVVDAPYQITGTYHVRFSATSSNALTSTATDTNYSVYINQNRYFSFTPEVSTEYLFYSFNDTGNPELTIYDEDFDLVTCNSTDMGLNYNFRITANLTAGETYYLAAHAYPGQTASYDFCILMPLTALNDTLVIKNLGSSLYMDIDGASLQTFFKQKTYDKYSRVLSKFTITLESNGYYTIRYQSENGVYYVGIPSIAIGTNIMLYSNISNNTLWKLYVKSSGEIFFEPKNAPGRALSATNSATGSNLTLKWMSDSLNGLNQWKFETPSLATLEAQQKTQWCWVATARMLVNSYISVSEERTQTEAVNHVKGSDIDASMENLDEVIKAASFFHADTDTYNELNLAGEINTRYSETTLRQFLNDSHVLWISRNCYDPSLATFKWGFGHAYIISGYTTEYKNGSIQYYYTVLDPNPAGINEEGFIWGDADNTGQIFSWTYDQICNAEINSVEDTADTRRWYKTIAVSTTSYFWSFITPDISQEN